MWLMQMEKIVYLHNISRRNRNGREEKKWWRQKNKETIRLKGKKKVKGDRNM